MVPYITESRVLASIIKKFFTPILVRKKVTKLADKNIKEYLEIHKLIDFKTFIFLNQLNLKLIFSLSLF